MISHMGNFLLRRNKFNGSPLLRRRYPQESSFVSSSNCNNTYGTENTSPLVLQRFYHQSQHLNNHLSSYPNTSSHYRYVAVKGISTADVMAVRNRRWFDFRSASLSPSRRYLTESVKLIDESKGLEENTHDGPKKRFSSYLNFHLNPTKDVRRNSPPTVPSPAPPSPPPRYNRLSSNSSSPANIPSSPLMMRRNFYDNPDSPVAARRLFMEGSPLLSRRYVDGLVSLHQFHANTNFFML